MLPPQQKLQPQLRIHGERLELWLSRQRKRWQARGMSEEARKAKSASALSDEEVARLDAVGVVWQPRRAGTSVIV